MPTNGPARFNYAKWWYMDGKQKGHFPMYTLTITNDDKKDELELAVYDMQGGEVAFLAEVLDAMRSNKMISIDPIPTDDDLQLMRDEGHNVTETIVHEGWNTK